MLVHRFIERFTDTSFQTFVSPQNCSIATLGSRDHKPSFENPDVRNGIGGSKLYSCLLGKPISIYCRRRPIRFYTRTWKKPIFPRGRNYVHVIGQENTTLGKSS